MNVIRAVLSREQVLEALAQYVLVKRGIQYSGRVQVKVFCLHEGPAPTSAGPIVQARVEVELAGAADASL